MPTVGFHASHEQLSPAALLTAVQAAEAAGFQAAMCSDHLAPWSERQGESGHAWSWLGAAMQATSLPFGVVTAPGQRYHPAITAQAIATLGDLFPGRFWAALGSGEALNEHVTGDPWPSKADRDARLLECVEVIRALLRGEEVTHDGLVRVDRAACGACRGNTAALRRRRQRGDRQYGRLLGRRPDHGAPALRRAPARDRSVPRGWRRWEAGRRPGAPLVGGGRGDGARDRPRPVAYGNVVGISRGTSSSPPSSTRQRRTCAPRT